MLHTFADKIHTPLKASQLQNIVSLYQVQSPTASSCRLSCSLSVYSGYTMPSKGTGGKGQWKRGAKHDMLLHNNINRYVKRLAAPLTSVHEAYLWTNLRREPESAKGVY